MTLDYSTIGIVRISMHKYVDNMLAESPSDMNGVYKTPVTEHLFIVDEGAKKLPEE